MKVFILIFVVLTGCGYTSQDSKITREIIVTSVHDGDTFTDLQGNKYRLAGLDCPELGQNYGLPAQAVTSGFILNKQVKISTIATDKYGRSVVNVWVSDVWLNELLVQSGLAWVYKSYDSDNLYQIMLIARRQRTGLWKDNNPEPPFMYRNRNRNTISLRPENKSYASSLVGVFGR